MVQPTIFGAPRIGDAPVTPEAFADRNDDSLDALLSSNSGSSRPPYSVQGTVWHNTSDTRLYHFDGSQDQQLAVENLVSNTALADASATLTAAEIRGGLFTITPTTARTLTTDTAVNILGELPSTSDGANVTFTLVNLAAQNVTVAAGTGVTIVGDAVVNSASATFMLYRTSATAVTLVRL